MVVDGRDRPRCAMNAPAALKPGGVIHWDNSERASYAEGIAFLANSGFRRLDFSGLGPVGAYAWRTSIFYKPDNCLGI